MRTNWWLSLSGISKKGHLGYLKKFLEWLERIEINTLNRLTVLKDYEQQRAKKIATQSTGLAQIRRHLVKGLENYDAETLEVRYLDSLLSNSKPLPAISRLPFSMGSFFGNISWIKAGLGEKWNFIESPKILIASFSITISQTLIFLMETKRNLYNDSSLVNGTKADLNAILELTLRRRNLWELELVLSDFVDQKHRPYILEHFHQNLFELDRKQIEFKSKKKFRYKFPELFLNKGDEFAPSKFEQVLLSWILALQMIQPTDIYALKPRNFIIQKNSRGRPLFIQCSYRKSRSNSRLKESPLISATYGEGKAIIKYLELYGTENNALLPKGRIKTWFAPHSFKNPCRRLLDIWKIKKVRENISRLHVKSSAKNLIIPLFESIESNAGPSPAAWREQQKKKGSNPGVAEYYREVKNPLPEALFGLMHIKTSAIYSRSDMYRENDLVNYNSHTAAVEKASYITDANKDWVNQHGRITRMVLADISNYTYKPNLNRAVSNARDMMLRTTVEKEEGCNTGLGLIDLNQSSSEGEIIVMDSVETVIYALHYINEAARSEELVANNNLTFYENVFLPKVEWMHYLLERKISPQNVAKGQKEFDVISKDLPELFTDQYTFSF